MLGMAVEGVVGRGEVLVRVGRRGVVEPGVEHGGVGEDWRVCGGGARVGGASAGGGCGLGGVARDEQPPGEMRVLDHGGEDVFGGAEGGVEGAAVEAGRVMRGITCGGEREH